MLKAKLIIGIMVSNLLVSSAFTLACVPQFSPAQAPPGPVPALPLPPDIEATVEAMVTERVREALAAIPIAATMPQSFRDYIQRESERCL